MTDTVISVLIVEDDPAHGEAMRRSFIGHEKLYKIRLASTIKECREHIASHSPDVMVADMKLPDGTVFDLLASLKDKIIFPIVVITSCGDETMAVRAIKAGAIDYVVKSPQTFADMPHMVTRVLREWSALENQKKTEKALQESEEKFEKAFSKNSALMAISTVTDGVYVDVNEAFLALLGFMREEVIGKTSVDLGIIDPGSRAMLLDRIAKEGAVHNIELPVRTKNGECKYGLFSADYLTLRGAQHLLTVMIDVTERKKADEMVLAAAREWETTFNATKDFFMVLDTQQRILQINEPTLRFLGKDRDAVIGQHCYKLFHGADLPLVDCPLVRMCNSKKHEEAELYLSNHHMWALVTADPIFNTKGALTHIIHTIKDITERKNTVEALKQSELRYRRIVETAGEGIVAVDEHGVITFVNKRMTDMLGYEIHDAIGRMASDFLPPGEREGNAHMIRERATGVFSSYERRFMHKNGTVLTMRVNATPVMDENSVFRGSFAMITDISDQKRAQDILRRDKETFEREVLEKSRELMQIHEQLERAKRLADIGALAATVAHELRSPLAAIALAVYNMRHSINDPAMVRHFSNINKKIAESDQIINNLLFYTKMKPPQKTRFAVALFFQELISSLPALFRDSRPLIKLTIDKNVMQDFVADQLQMRELFENLLNNSIDAVENKIDGTITVDVSCPDGKMLKVVVSDNGVGIREEDMKRIHDPFFTTKAKGTGLGLAVCNEIVRLHSGSIDIKSEYGKGATVKVALPIQGYGNPAMEAEKEEP